jgi:hypothetical protein
MWCSGALAEMPSARAISLVGSPRASRPTTSASRTVRPAGRVTRGGGCPAASSTAATAAASVRCSNRPCTAAGIPSRALSLRDTSQIAAMWSRCSRAARSSPAARSRGEPHIPGTTWAVRSPPNSRAAAAASVVQPDWSSMLA